MLIVRKYLFAYICISKMIVCLKKVLKAVKKTILVFTRYIPLFVRKKLNNNKDFTLISRNCIGGFIYHQYGLKFLSPTINLFFDLHGFNYFCNYLHEYVFGNIIQKEDKVGIIYPTDNTLPPITVCFFHYPSFEEGLKKWNERKKRINWDNIYVVNSCTSEHWRDLVNDEIVENFNKIPYKKVIFTERKYGFDNEFVFKDSKTEFYQFPLSWKYGFNQFGFNKFFRKRHFKPVNNLK